MSAPKLYPSGYVSGIYPTANQSGISISGLLYTAYSYILDSSCNNYLNSDESPIRLYKDISQTTYGTTLVSGQWSQDPQASGLRIYIVPASTLDYSTWYRIYFDAEKAIDNSSSGYYPAILYGSGTAPLNYELRFLTENRPQSSSSGSTTVTVASCTPDYGEIDVFPTGITIYFDHVISGSISDWSTYVTISGKSIFGGRKALATYSTGVYTMGPWETTITSGVWGGGSYINLSSGSWPADIEVFVNIASTLPFISGTWAGYIHEFTTYYDPYYCSPTMVRMHGGGYYDGFTDEFLNTFIVMESTIVEKIIGDADSTELGLLPEYVALSVAKKIAGRVELKAKMQSISPLAGGYPGALRRLGTLELFGDSLSSLLKAGNGSLTSSIDAELEDLRRRIWRLVPGIAIKAEYDLRRPITDWTWRRWDEATLDDILRERLIEYWSNTNEF